MLRLSIISTFMVLVLYACSRPPSESQPIILDPQDNRAEFEESLGADWQVLFTDSGTQNWQDQWSLDGLYAQVVNDPNGMTFSAGKEWKNDAHHAVLWTKKSFIGDIKIEYDFTKMDNELRAVNILYILATGKEMGPYVKDIAKWNKLREVPAMKSYFNNMNTYHFSYAAYGLQNDDINNDYIRARRYLPLNNNGLKQTEFGQSYENTGFFKQGVEHHIICIKRGNKLFFNVSNHEHSQLYVFDGSALPEITNGRIGLRQMYTRSSRYKNFTVSELK